MQLNMLNLLVKYLTVLKLIYKYDEWWNWANKFKAELAQKAKDAGLEELYTFIDHVIRDEARHASISWNA